MNRIILLIFVGFVVFSCEKGLQSSRYKPKFTSEWNTVEQKILDTWKQSKVDSTAWQMPGSLQLPLTYFSIHPDRNVLFGWDTYFTNEGLLFVDSFKVYARNAVENQFAEIEQIGYVPNSSEPWGINRSQPPYLSMSVRRIYETDLADKEWLAKAFGFLKKEYTFWTDTSSSAIETHKTPVLGLQRYSNCAGKEELLKFYDEIKHRFDFPDSLSDDKKIALANAWMTEAESGMGKKGGKP